MSQLPVGPLSAEQQQKIMGQMYLLVEKQVQSYHKHRHMGNNSSVPVELARELLESIEYTINQTGGAFVNQKVEETLKIGQKILDSKVSRAKSMLDLVIGTAPHWQTECRCEALQYLARYLDRYDYLHLAHREPTDLFYPILISQPEDLRGIDICVFYLNVLWIENQIMAGVPDDALDRFWDRLPTDTLNQCERLLINGIGKIMIDSTLDSLIFETADMKLLTDTMKNSTKDDLFDAAKILCDRLNLKDDSSKKYVEATVPLLSMWTGENVKLGHPENLFI